MRLAGSGEGELTVRVASRREGRPGQGCLWRGEGRSAARWITDNRLRSGAFAGVLLVELVLSE